MSIDSKHIAVVDNCLFRTGNFNAFNLRWNYLICLLSVERSVIRYLFIRSFITPLKFSINISCEDERYKEIYFHGTFWAKKYVTTFKGMNFLLSDK